MISNPPSERRWRSINRAEVDALCLIRKRNSWKRSIRKRNEEKTTKFPFTFTRPKFLPPPKKKKNKILLKYKNTKSLRLQKAFRYLVNSPPPNIEPNIEHRRREKNFQRPIRFQESLPVYRSRCERYRAPIPIPDNDAARYLMEAREREIDPPMRATKRREKKARASEQEREGRKEGRGGRREKRKGGGRQ